MVIETSDETVKLNPATVTKESLNSEVDLVVLTPKSYDFAEAIEVVQNVQGKPFLLPFLNGFVKAVLAVLYFVDPDFNEYVKNRHDGGSVGHET